MEIVTAYALYRSPELCWFDNTFSTVRGKAKKPIYLNVYWNTINNRDSQIFVPQFFSGRGHLFTGYVLVIELMLVTLGALRDYKTFVL